MRIQNVLVDLLVVDVGAVARAEVLDEEAPVVVVELEVLARDARGEDLDPVPRVATDQLASGKDEGLVSVGAV